MKIRIFIAIELNSGIQSKLMTVQEVLKKSEADVKWVKPENIHLTLKFLGHISESRLKDIFKATDESIKGITPFSLLFSGLGAFPKLDNPRVVWVGVIEDQKTLFRINENLEDTLKRNGFPAEERGYRPHLTLGRVKSSQNKAQLISSLKSEKDYFVGSMEAKKITVMQSILKPEGSEYKPLHVSKIKPRDYTRFTQEK
ncbi:RNA 2',3'-cyclic phosphodiesterase [candidate division NPL-UPA2 bacterium]|nr:RNA 2',3'-cyclic phosphodiesterase [candidate division NPL-UPA2 bacterium]